MKPIKHQQQFAPEIVQYEDEGSNFLQRLVKSKLKSIKRAQYGIIFLVCSAVLFFQCGQCALKYLDKETGTADKYVHVSNVSFPELTICPTYPYREDVLKENGIERAWEVQFGASWISNDSNTSPVQFYEDMTLDIEDIVDNTLFYLEQPINGSNILRLKPLQLVCDGVNIFQVKEYYFNGDCFSMQIPECLHKAGPLEVVFDFYDKTDIFIHHHGQFLSPNSRSRVDVARGYFTKIAINHEVVQMLGGEEFSTCVNQYDGFETFDECMYKTMQKLMLEQVGCTVPWIPDKSNICVEEGKRKAAFEVYQQNRRNQKDICPNSCLFTNMYFGPPVTGQNNEERSKFAWGVFYFRRDIKVTTEYFLYSLLSMAAEIGGYVGLLLGASLVNIGQINNFLLDYFYGGVEELTADRLRKMTKSPFKRLSDFGGNPNHVTNTPVTVVNQRGYKVFHVASAAANDMFGSNDKNHTPYYH